MSTPEPPDTPLAVAATAGLDYPALLAEGTALTQRLTGAIWTNYNWSDPGVTILQQLCYALTELSYRSDFPVADLLADHATGRVRLRRQALYPAHAIMPVNPVTRDDLRRLVIDRVALVGNAWFTPLPAGPDGVRGLYRIQVLVPAYDPGCEHDGPDPEAVRRAVLDCYTAHRALCEDVTAVVVLRPIRARVFATVQLDDHADPNAVLAELLFRLGLALSPEPKRRSLDALRAAGRTTAEIFEGPLMLRGFIADEQLGPLPDRISVEHLLELAAEVPGVLAVERFAVEVQGRRYLAGETIVVPEGHLLWLETSASEQGHGIVLRHGASVCPTSPLRVQRMLARHWADQRRTYDLWQDYARDYPPPLGRRIDLAAYTSVQDQFPAVYGIGAFGLPSNAGPVRHAQARQLKGYLMVFDQLMADFFAQLGFVRTLFSVTAGGDRTYVGQSLRGIVPAVEPLLEPGYELRLRALIARDDPVLARQDAVLDFMLSIYAEGLALPADAACGTTAEVSQAALVDAKKTLLARMVPATRDRGRGFDYRRARGDGPASRLDLRCRIELALLDASLHGDETSYVEAPEAASFGRLLPEALGASIIERFLPVSAFAQEDDEGAEDAAAPSPIAGHSIAAALAPALADSARYRVGAAPDGGSVYLVCIDLHQRCWLIEAVRDVIEAIALMRRIVRAAGVTEARLTLVEWILLRYAREAGDSGCDPGYSFRISAVMPAGEGDGDGRREQATEIVRANMPAHVVVEPLFLGRAAMRAFRALHQRWVRALRRGEPGPRAAASRALQDFLEAQR